MSRLEGNPKPQYDGMSKEEKTAAYTRAYYDKNQEKLKAYGRVQSKRYREENKEMVLQKKLNQWLVLNFKRTTEWYESTLLEQGGHCFLCNYVPSGRRLQVDHDHKCCPTDKAHRRTCGKCIRGLLCENCNTDLGRLENWLQQMDLTLSTIVPTLGTWLDKALQYLEEYAKETQSTCKA
jgi:hypothetical protein